MEFSTKFDAKAIESEIKEYVKSINIEKLIFASDKPEKIRFIEGPPTMNGIPHAGHLRGRVIKDFKSSSKNIISFHKIFCPNFTRFKLGSFFRRSKNFEI